MSDTTRAILHEVMEQQTVSIAKAGVIASLNARTAILAAANPIHSRWNPKLSVVENIRLGPTLLSRFDLIYLVLDKPSEGNDRRLAKHLVSMYYPEDEKSNSENAPRFLNVETLSAYISYVRKYVHPRIGEEAAEKLIAGYTAMRRRGQNKKVITATPRQLESMIRLSESLAKLRMSEVVEPQDVDEAIRLMDVSLGQSATDPETGLIDIDMFAVGFSSSWRRSVERHVERLRNIIAQLPTNSIRFHELMRRFNESEPGQSEESQSSAEFRKIVDALAGTGFIRVLQQNSSNPEVRRLGEGIAS
jgi:DNA replication licensing factor MCM4